MNKIDIDEANHVPKPKRSAISGDIIGVVNQTLGTGKHAQDSVVWLTIRWSLIIGSILSVFLIIFMWPPHPDGTHPPIEGNFPIEQLKTIWSIFVPIITLALGYMFGKGR